MNKYDVGKILGLASGFDRRVVDPLTIEAWALVPELMAASYEDAKAAVIAHQTGPKRHEYLTIGHIVDALDKSGRRTAFAIAADVRSARARRLIPMDWPEDLPLDDDVAAQLEVLRDTERTAAKEREAKELGTLETEDAPTGNGEMK